MILVATLTFGVSATRPPDAHWTLADVCAVASLVATSPNLDGPDASLVPPDYKVVSDASPYWRRVTLRKRGKHRVTDIGQCPDSTRKALPSDTQFLDGDHNVSMSPDGNTAFIDNSRDFHFPHSHRYSGSTVSHCVMKKADGRWTALGCFTDGMKQT